MIPLADVGARVADGSLLVAAPIAFAAGFVSFASPCVLPLVPGYLSFVTGLTGSEVAASEVSASAGPAGGGDGRVATRTRRRRLGPVVVGCVGFVAGFSAVFVSFGAIFGGFGQLLRDHADALTRAFGVVTILLGLTFMGVIGARSVWLNRDLRVHRLPPARLWGGPALGAAFAFGWTPCIGPTLAAVLNLAAASDRATAGRGALLALCYCLGLGIPFLAFGLAAERAARVSGWLRRRARTIELQGGGMLVAVGAAQVLGVWGWLVGWLTRSVSGTTLPL